MKRRAQRMARPRPTPLPEGSTQNMAIEEIRLKSSEPVQTGHRQKQGGGKESCWRTSSTAAVFVALLQTCGRQLNLLYSKRKMLLVRMWLMQYYAIHWFTLPTAGFNARLCLLSSCQDHVKDDDRTSASTRSRSPVCNRQMKIL